MRSLAIPFLLLTVLCSSCTQKKVTPVSEEEKTLYAMGAMLFGTRLRSLNLTDEEATVLLQGARDGMNNDSQIDIDEYVPKMREFAETRGRSVLEATRQEGTEFVERYMREEGEDAKRTESGLVYKIIEEGSGEKPSGDDTVKVRYKGEFVDGSVFDESMEEGVDLPLGQVIRGWSEGIQMLAPGGKIELVIPPDIGYGDYGRPPKIPGASTLRFNIELISVVERGGEEEDGASE